MGGNLWMYEYISDETVWSCSTMGDMVMSSPTDTGVDSQELRRWSDQMRTGVVFDWSVHRVRV